MVNAPGCGVSDHPKVSLTKFQAHPGDSPAARVAKGPVVRAGDFPMTDSTTISSAQLFSDDANEFFIDAGVPRHNRRLADKVLAAFNHAYAAGEMDLARALWDCLVTAEKLGQPYARRQPNQSLDLAAEWVAFVDARDRYRDVSRTSKGRPEEASDAFRTMRDAYQAWQNRNVSESASHQPADAGADEAEYAADASPLRRPGAAGGND